MTQLTRSTQRDLSPLVTAWRNRRQATEAQREADLADLADQLAARAQARHAARADVLGDHFGTLLVLRRQRNAQLAGGDPATQMDLDDVFGVLKYGLLGNLSSYVSAGRF